MPINCLINRRVKETKSQRVKETKRQRDKESKRQRVKETKRQRDGGGGVLTTTETTRDNSFASLTHRERGILKVNGATGRRRSQRDKETKRGRVKESKSRRVEETKRRRAKDER